MTNNKAANRGSGWLEDHLMLEETLAEAMEMTARHVPPHDSEAPENVLDGLTDSVLDLSDEEILAEVRKNGTDPGEYAERARNVLKQALRKFDNVSRRLEKLGHAIMDWQAREGVYESKCKTCGLSVSFSSTSDEIWGEASVKPCQGKDQYNSQRG